MGGPRAPRGFWLLVCGYAVSSYGNFLNLIALGLFSYHLTGSASAPASALYSGASLRPDLPTDHPRPEVLSGQGAVPGQARTELYVVFTLTEASFTLDIEYSTDLFTPTTIASWATALTARLGYEPRRTAASS